MLPFLSKVKKQAGIAGTIIKNRTPDEKPEENQEDSSSIEDCAAQLITAVHAHDKQGVVDAMKDIFQKLEDEPHEEAGTTPAPHSYDAQNQKAGENE